MNEVLQTGAERKENQMTNADTTTAAGTAPNTPQGASVTPAPAKATTQKKAAPKAKTAKQGGCDTPKGNGHQAVQGRRQIAGGGRIEAVIRLLRRKEWATAAEIAKLTNSAAHDPRLYLRNGLEEHEAHRRVHPQ